jgi:hypothetical protein
MVTLFVDDLDQLTILEYLLFTYGIDHNIELNDGRYGIQAPFLLVYGVPLDEKRSIRWILGQSRECYCE